MPDTMEKMLIIVVVGIRAYRHFAAIHQTIGSAGRNPGIFRGTVVRTPQLGGAVKSAIIILVVEKVGVGRTVLGVEKCRAKHKKAQSQRK